MTELNPLGSLIPALRRQREQSEEIASEEISRDRSMADSPKWSEYRSGIRAYEKDLGLEEGTLQLFVDEKKKNGIEPKGLDVMGEGAILRELGIYGSAITLSDLRTPEERVDTRINMVYENVLKPEAWSQLNESFDLIVCRPVMGIHNLTSKPAFHFWLLDQMWEHLAVDGMLCAEVPYESEKLLHEWKNQIESNRIPVSLEICKIPYGSNNDRYMQSLILKKNKESPKKLPRKFTPLENI